MALRQGAKTEFFPFKISTFQFAIIFLRWQFYQKQLLQTLPRQCVLIDDPVAVFTRNWQPNTKVFDLVRRGFALF